MYRFFENRNYDGNSEISKENFHHLKNVIRIREDENFEIVFNDGIYIFNLVDDKFILKEKSENKNESDVKLTLIFGILKGQKNEEVLKAATEIGVSEFIPVQMDFCVSDISKKEDKKLQRWQKIVESAAKQSKRDFIPQIKNVIKSDDILNLDMDFILCYESEKNLRLKDISNKLSKNIGLIIGPEGGISKRELELFKDIYKISLGKRILRAETASIVASFNIIYNMESD